MSANRKNGFLPLGIDFVENIMPYAPSVYTVIYICALNMGNGALAENVAKKLNMSVMMFLLRLCIGRTDIFLDFQTESLCFRRIYRLL